MFTIDSAAATLDTKEIVWLGKPCTLTAVPVATLMQLRANWPAPVAPRGVDDKGDYLSPAYQAQLMADSREMQILELAASIDLQVVIGWSVVEGSTVRTRNAAATALSEVLSLPTADMAAASEVWCKEAMKVLGGLSGERLKPLEDAYRALSAVDTAAGARGN